VPLLIALAVVIAAFALTLALLPFAIVFRYRYGTKRRRARAWVATINTLSLLASATMFLITAAITNRWAPPALAYSAAGLAGGGILGLLGLALTRWEHRHDSLHYTPSRLLVLSVTLVVAARIAYGFWRAWNTWRSGAGDASWLAAIGIPGTMAAGAVVLGYYLVYWAGVRSRATMQP
jgi:hypothetical protein